MAEIDMDKEIENLRALIARQKELLEAERKRKAEIEKRASEIAERKQQQEQEQRELEELAQQQEKISEVERLKQQLAESEQEFADVQEENDAALAGVVESENETPAAGSAEGSASAQLLQEFKPEIDKPAPAKADVDKLAEMNKEQMLAMIEKKQTALAEKKREEEEKIRQEAEAQAASAARQEVRDNAQSVQADVRAEREMQAERAQAVGHKFEKKDRTTKFPSVEKTEVLPKVEVKAGVVERENEDEMLDEPSQKHEFKKKGLWDKFNDLFKPKDAKNAVLTSWVEPEHQAQNDLGFELLREDGVMRVEEGLYARCVQFEDVNYQGALYDTQLDIHSNMNELYNSLPESCGIQLFMFTRKMHSNELNETLHIDLEPSDDGYNDLREEQNKIVDLKMSQTAQNVKRIHCFVITCEEVNMQRAKSVLDRACGGIERKLRDIESEHKVLDGKEWLTLINHVTNPDDEEGIIDYSDLIATLGATTRDLIAPPNITTYGFKGLSMGDYFYRLLYVSKFSTTVRDDFFSQLAEMPYNSIISMHAKPYDHADAVDLVDGKKTDLNMQKKQYIRKNPSAAYQDEELLPGSLGEQLNTVRETRTDLLQREQSMFDVSIVITLFSKSETELENAFSEVKRIAKGYNCRVSPLNDMQMLGLKSALPVGNNSVPISRAIMTDALSNFVPFTSDELMQKNGLFGGINQLSKNVIAYDRTKAIAPNGFILGKTGRGKSVHAKYQIIQLLCRDPKAKCIVLDPEGEYGGLCKLLPHAQHIKVTNSGDVHINPLDVTETYSDDGNPLSFKADFVVSLVDMMTGGMSTEQLNVLDRCVQQIYNTYFQTKNIADMPTLQTLYDELKQQPEQYAQDLAVNIERFVLGSMNVFNAHTNVELDARLVVFDTKELQKNMSPVALLILLDQVWNFITSGRASGTHTWFFVDEMQLLKDNAYAVDYLDKLFTRARKWGAIPTGITQNVERVLKIDQFRYMIANSDFLVILGQSKTDTNALGDVLKLSDEQKKAVVTAGIGQGILLANGKVVQFENLIPKEIYGKPSKIYRALTTKLEDLVEMGEIG